MRSLHTAHRGAPTHRNKRKTLEATRAQTQYSQKSIKINNLLKKNKTGKSMLRFNSSEDENSMNVTKWQTAGSFRRQQHLHPSSRVPPLACHHLSFILAISGYLKYSANMLPTLLPAFWLQSEETEMHLTGNHTEQTGKQENQHKSWLCLWA